MTTTAEPGRLARVGDVVRTNGWLLLGYLLVGVVLTGAALAAGSATDRASPTHGCRIAMGHDGWTARFPWRVSVAEPPGIVALELAGSADAAAAIVERWPACAGSQAAAEQAADRALRLDSFAFVPLYCASLLWWCAYTYWSVYRPRVRRLAGAVLVAVVAAGALDLVENLALRQVVGGDAEPWAVVATAASVPKWVIVVAALLTAAVGFFGALRRLGGIVLRGESSRPQFYGPMQPDEPEILVPLGPEEREVDRVARRSCDPHGAPWPSEAIGICLSGGGIRAASFGIGALQGLQAPGPEGASIYERSRYLSTVSGGGYAGTAAQIIAHQHPDGPLPLQPGSSEVRTLRHKRRYLWGEPVRPHRWQSTQEFLGAVGLLVAGIAFNATLVAACAYAVTRPLGWAARVAVFAGGGAPDPPPRQLTPGMVIGTGATIAVTYLLLRQFMVNRAAARWPDRLVLLCKVAVIAVSLLVVVMFAFPRGLGWVLVPLALAGASIPVHFLLRRVRRSEAHDPQGSGSWVAAPLTALLLGLVLTVAWYWAHQGFHRGPAGPVSAAPAVLAVALLGAVAVALGVGALLRVCFDGARRRCDPPWPSVLLLAGVGAAVGAGIEAFVAVRRYVEGPAEPAVDDLGVWLWVVFALAVVYLFGDQKHWSPHPFYKARLARTFALTRWGTPASRPGASAGQPASSLPYRVRTTLSEWGAKPERGPELLICAAAYDTIEQRPDRLPAWPFVFSHRYVGGCDVGWARTVDFESVVGRSNLGDSTLQAAMAVSGAAVSPALGRIRLGPLNSVIAAANLRLGVWMPGPRWIATLRDGDEPKPSWVRRRRFTYLLKEVTGSYDLDARLVYLTDGGQFDNLGLFELLARGCSTIYCFDASGDLKPGELSTKTFDDTRELARVRLGVLFSLPGQAPDGSSPADGDRGTPVSTGALTADFVERDTATGWDAEPRVPVAKENVVALDIHYPGRSQGRLLYAKCLLTRNVPGDVRRYAQSPAGRPRFPGDSTIDQWIDEDQFDAYVSLGQTVARRAAVLAP